MHICPKSSYDVRNMSGIYDMLPMKAYMKRNWLVTIAVIFCILLALAIRLGYLMLHKSETYAKNAQEVWQRERTIKAARGHIYDRNGVVLATNQSVCTVSVIHNQIKDPETVIRVLADTLHMTEETVRKRVEKYSSIERIKANVDKETGDYLKAQKLEGVVVDEDYRRTYPIGDLASRVIGFTGGDNQGIIGLEVMYNDILAGKNGTILTTTTAHGLNIDGAAEGRVEPVAGLDLYISLDYNIQLYCQQAARTCLAATGAKTVSIVMMNPQNGEILAMTTLPEFDANAPFAPCESLLYRTDENGEKQPYEWNRLNEKEKTEFLNGMWRNPLISDTYEPGSTFKIVTSTAAFEAGVLKVTDRFHCPGHYVVEDRVIHCHKRTGHGSEDFKQGIMNSCNPVFMQIAERTGAVRTYETYRKLGLFERTGVDLPGEANSIMHRLEDIGPVELATMSFGQSFQITPMQLLTAAACVVNGGARVTPHLGVSAMNAESGEITEFAYEQTDNCISSETSSLMRELLHAVVAEGTGKRAYLEGYTIGGKTATSQKLPRSARKYIASFLGFAPAENPQVMALVLIDEPVGVYYGGTIAAPVIKEVFATVLPYLGIEKQKTKEDN